VRHTLTDLWTKLLGDQRVPPDVIERDVRWWAVQDAIREEERKSDEAAERSRG
jgi:hypothetical protein